MLMYRVRTETSDMYVHMRPAMSKKKLTLSVDERVILRAKRFSAEHDTTLSQLVTDFLDSLDAGPDQTTPVVARLRGLLRPGTEREDYRKHLSQKHGR